MQTKFNIGDHTNCGVVTEIRLTTKGEYCCLDNGANVPSAGLSLRPKMKTITQAEYDALVAIEATAREWACHLVGSYPTRSQIAREQLYDLERARANKN